MTGTDLVARCARKTGPVEVTDLLFEDQIVSGPGDQHGLVLVLAEVNVQPKSVGVLRATVQECGRSASPCNRQLKVALHYVTEQSECRDEVALARAVRSDQDVERAKFHVARHDRLVTLHLDSVESPHGHDSIVRGRRDKGTY